MMIKTKEVDRASCNKWDRSPTMVKLGRERKIFDGIKLKAEAGQMNGGKLAEHSGKCENVIYKRSGDWEIINESSQ